MFKAAVRTLFLYLSFVSTAVPAPVSEIATPHFRIVNEGFSDRYARRTADAAESSLATISRALGTIPDSAITITLAASGDRFRELTEGSLPDWSAAAAMKGGRIVLTPLEGNKIEMEKILAHEIVHVVINDAVRDKYVPRWFHEGCAELYSGQWGFRNELYMSWMVVRGNLLSFQDIQDVFSRGSLDAGLAYDQAMIAVRRLVAMYGEKTLPRLLSSMREEKEFRGAFRYATGYSPEEFERDYLSFLKDTYGVKMLVTLLPGTWTAMMALFLAVYLVKRRRAKRKLEAWNALENATGPRIAPDEAEYDDGSDEDDDIILDDEGESHDEYDGQYEQSSNVIRFKPRPRRFGGYPEE